MRQIISVAVVIMIFAFSCKKTSTPTPVPVPKPDPNASLKDGLIAYYPFSGNLDDSSSNHFNGKSVGIIGFGADRTGVSNKALQLNGDSSYVTVGDDVKLDLTNKMTITLEFYPETSDPYSLVAKRTVGDGAQSFHLMCNYQSPSVFSVIKGGKCSPANIISDWSNAFTDNTLSVRVHAWNCIVAIFDGTSQKVYLNGAKAADLPIDFATMGGCAGTDIRFGYWWNFQPYSYKGRLDEIRIYNRVLTTDEIGKLCSSNNF